MSENLPNLQDDGDGRPGVLQEEGVVIREVLG